MKTKSKIMWAHVRKSGRILCVHEQPITYLDAKKGDLYLQVKVTPIRMKQGPSKRKCDK